MSKMKTLVFDVDGTICESCQVISDEMVAVLEKLPHDLVFISGTHIKELTRMISSKLKRKHYILSNSGTHQVEVIDDNGTEIFKESLEFKDKMEIIKAFTRLIDIYKLKPKTNYNDQLQDRGSQITLSILGRNASKENKAKYDPDNKKRSSFINFLIGFLQLNKYSIKIGGTTSIDITYKDRNKKYGLQKFLEFKKLKMEDLLFFGDQLKEGGNDYPVKEMGVECVEVQDEKETLKRLKRML